MTTIAETIRAGRPLGQDVPVISGHTHVGAGWNLPVIDGSGDSILRSMDRCGIDISCISSMGSLSSDLEGGNAEVAREVERHPDRYIGTPVFNPHYPRESLRELERYFSRPGFGMIKVHPKFHSYAMDGPDYDRAWAFAAERRIPVLVHTWDQGDGVDHPLLAATVASRYPRVPLLLAHAGGTPAGVKVATTVAKEHPNLYLETSTGQGHRGFIEFLVDAVGADRVMFGTDAIYLDDAGQLGRVAGAELSEADKRKILGGNLLRLLRAADVQSLPALERLQ